MKLSCLLSSRLTTPCSSSFSKSLYIYEAQSRNSVSGIRATIFGGTGFVGPYAGAILGYIGSDIIFPHNHEYIYDDDVKELRLCAGTGYVHLVKHFDFDDPKMYDRVIKNSNVVINLVGPRLKVKARDEFDYINIEISKRIAQACKRNPEVLRLIQFSSAGAAANADSQDFATKYIAEKEVLDIFPDATIFRPTTIYGSNDYFVRQWLTAQEFWYNKTFVTDDCKAMKQPILVNDVAQCILNALKLPESCGQTYDLGGPAQYTQLELYEIMSNIIQRPPQIHHVNYDWAIRLAQRLPNFTHFSKENMIKHRTDIIVNPKNKQIDDLFVQPVSFHYGVRRFMHENKARYGGDKELDER